jgi:hypothetical protein
MTKTGLLLAGLLTCAAFVATAPSASAVCTQGGGDCVTVQGGNACWSERGSNGNTNTYCVGLDGVSQCYTDVFGTHCYDIL